MATTPLPNGLAGPRAEIDIHSKDYPSALKAIADPPEKLYVIGNPEALVPGLAVIGARRATPYGLTCARRFARLAAEKGVNIISGGARGCDSESHRAALEVGGSTVVFLGGGCDAVYPPEHLGLFQNIIDSGGAVVSEQHWTFYPLRYTFRARNRLIAGLADAVLIVEAGMPSGTFSTADEALEAGKDVFVVPGAITSKSSRGSNRLLYQGAIPIIDDESFEDALFESCGVLKRPGVQGVDQANESPIIEAILAQPMDNDQLLQLAEKVFGHTQAQSMLMEHLIQAETNHVIVRQPDGKWGSVMPV